MSKAAEKIRKALRKNAEDEAAWEKKLAEYAAEDRLKKAAFKRIRASLGRADVGDYIAWLRGHLNNGGRVTHVYDYPFNQTRWFVAWEGFTMHPFYGAGSFNVIVPEGISVVGETGHCDIYYMDGFKQHGWGRFVPIYSDRGFRPERF